MKSPSDDAAEANWIVPTRPVRFRMPSLMLEIEPELQAYEVVAPPGQRTWEIPAHNATINYDLRVTEYASHLVFEAEIARVQTDAPKALYEKILDFNGRLGAKVVYERRAKADGNLCDSIQMSQQIPKYGLPSSVILEEVAAFDNGVQKLSPIIHEAIRDCGATPIEIYVEDQPVIEDYLGLIPKYIESAHNPES